MSTDLITAPQKHVKKAYFGVTALLTSVFSGLFLGANFGVAYLKITPSTFSQLNSITALFFCLLTPLTIVLGVIGYRHKNDSRALSRAAIILVLIPFLIMFAQFAYYFLR